MEGPLSWHEFLRWLQAFSATLLVELPIALSFCRRFEPSRWRLLSKLVLANLATHPLVWFGFATLPLPPRQVLALAEGFALLAEAAAFLVVFPGMRPRRAFLASLAANLASFAVGEAVHRMLGWPG